jgi:hypothetical protein
VKKRQGAKINAAWRGDTENAEKREQEKADSSLALGMTGARACDLRVLAGASWQEGTLSGMKG